MDPREDIEQTLRRHRRSLLRPWRCRCGRLRPCTAWQFAAEERFALNCRERLNRSIAHMRNQPQPTEARGGDRITTDPHR